MSRKKQKRPVGRPRNKTVNTRDPEIYAISAFQKRLLQERLRELPHTHPTMRVYDYIVDSYERSKSMPTYKMIAEAISSRSLNTVTTAIIDLVKAGWLEEVRSRKNASPQYRPPAAPYGNAIRDFYLWYRAYYMTNGVLPSFNRCCEQFGYKSRATIGQMMKVLKDNGVVKEVTDSDKQLHKYVPLDTLVVDRREYEKYKSAYNVTQTAVR